jgi:hypothetical protein
LRLAGGGRPRNRVWKVSSVQNSRPPTGVRSWIPAHTAGLGTYLRLCRRLLGYIGTLLKEQKVGGLTVKHFAQSL